MINFVFRDVNHSVRSRCPARVREAGVTLIELMITVVLIAIGLALAVPSFNDFRQRSSLRGAIESYSSMLSEGRFDAVKRNRYTEVDFSTITLPSGITVSSASTIGGGSNKLTIDPKYGILTAAGDAGSLTLAAGPYQLRFVVTPLGRGSTCSSGTALVPGYSECAP